MKRRIYLLTGATVMLWLVQGVVCAEEHASQELKKELYGKLKRADANQDGILSYEEYQAFQEIKIRQKFEKMDRNGDGFVSAEEQFNERNEQ